jgi:hypothetical protein
LRPFSSACGLYYSYKQFGDSTVNIHLLRKPQTDELTSTGFIMFKNTQTTGKALVALNGTQTPSGDTLDLPYARRKKNQSFGVMRSLSCSETNAKSRFKILTDAKSRSSNHYNQDSYGIFNQKGCQYLHTGTTLTKTHAIRQNRHQLGIGEIK